MTTPRIRRTPLLSALVAAATICALMLPGSALAAGPFKSVATILKPTEETKISGGLDVAKRCRAKRTIRIYGANLASQSQDLPLLGVTTTANSGSWARTVAFRDHIVLVLVPKRVKGKLCAGGAMLLEIGGPT